MCSSSVTAWLARHTGDRAAVLARLWQAGQAGPLTGTVGRFVFHRFPGPGQSQGRGAHWTKCCAISVCKCRAIPDDTQNQVRFMPL